MEDYNLTQETLSKRLGISRSTLANTIRILNLDEDVIKLAKIGALSEGHCKAIISIKNKEMQKVIANKVNETSASVRETENMIKQMDEKTYSIKENTFVRDLSGFNNRNVIQINTLNKWRTAEEQCISIEEYMGNKAVDVSKQNLGYDIESIDKNKNKRYIEVKSITSDTASFTMTNNEYSAANMYKNNYYLCLLVQINKVIKVICIKIP